MSRNTICILLSLSLSLLFFPGCVQKRGAHRGVGGIPEKGQRTSEDIQRDRTKRDSIEEYEGQEDYGSY